jgi:TPR repeat protein
MAAGAHAEQAGGSMEKAVALRNEARSYEHGEGVKREPAKAVQLYCESARLGDVEAQQAAGVPVR